MKKTSKQNRGKSGWGVEPYPLTKGNKKQKKRLPQPYAAIKNYLSRNGWNVAVIGGTSVEQGSLDYNFIFRCNFTGSKIFTPQEDNKN